MSFSAVYAKLFSRGLLAKINNRILNMSLRARGYNNFRDGSESGENFFIKSILSITNPKLCIDVGAHIGGYTSQLLINTGSKVISFEPLPDAFKSLSLNTKEYSERVTLVNKGVGKFVGNQIIHYDPNALSHASFSEDIKKVDYVSNEKELAVPVVTLDSYCDENDIDNVDLIKIDTEGFEGEVFEGAVLTFEKLKPKFIQIEFNWHQLFRKTSLNFFSEKLTDYDVYQLIPNGWVKRDPRDPLVNIYHFSNFVFVLRN